MLSREQVEEILNNGARHIINSYTGDTIMTYIKNGNYTIIVHSYNGRDIHYKTYNKIDNEHIDFEGFGYKHGQEEDHFYINNKHPEIPSAWMKDNGIGYCHRFECYCGNGVCKYIINDDKHKNGAINKEITSILF